MEALTDPIEQEQRLVEQEPRLDTLPTEPQKATGEPEEAGEEELPRWKKYLKPVKPVPEVFSEDAIYALADKYSSKRDRILFLICYLTGGRISEVLALRRLDINRETPTKLGGKEVLTFNLITKKNKKYPTRKIPCVLEGICGQMAEEVWAYVKDMEYEDSVFPNLSRTNAWNRLARVQVHIRAMKENQYIEKDLKIYPHYLRHSRLTNLVEVHSMNTTYLMYFAGWTSIEMAERYVRRDYIRIAKEMMS